MEIQIRLLLQDRANKRLTASRAYSQPEKVFPMRWKGTTAPIPRGFARGLKEAWVVRFCLLGAWVLISRTMRTGRKK